MILITYQQIIKDKVLNIDNAFNISNNNMSIFYR